MMHTLTKSRVTRPKVGLVLSGGSARGFGHIGVLKTLHKNNIPIDVVAGCSTGAFIGSLYCFDPNPEKIEHVALKIKNFNDIFDFSFSTTGLIKGEKLIQYLMVYMNETERPTSTKTLLRKNVLNKKVFDKYVGNYVQKLDAKTLNVLSSAKHISEEPKLQRLAITEKIFTFEDFKIPLKINATNIITGEEKVFFEGPIIPAVLSSIAIPGVFVAKRIGDELFVDGGIVDPVPWRLLAECDYLIVVNVAPYDMMITQNSGLKDLVHKSLVLMENTLAKDSVLALQQSKIKHLVIEPKLSQYGDFEFQYGPEMIATGEKATELLIPQIKKDLKL